MMSAKNHKAKFADPLIARLKALLKKALAKFFQMQDRYHELDKAYSKLYRTNERLTQEIAVLHSENAELRDANAMLRQRGKEYALLKKAFGKEQVGQLLEKAREVVGHRSKNR